jgi:hypothetical protein
VKIYRANLGERSAIKMCGGKNVKREGIVNSECKIRIANIQTRKKR